MLQVPRACHTRVLNLKRGPTQALNYLSSAESAAILVGRVVKVHENEALFMEFRCVDSSEGLYRPVVWTAVGGNSLTP